MREVKIKNDEPTIASFLLKKVAYVKELLYGNDAALVLQPATAKDTIAGVGTIVLTGACKKDDRRIFAAYERVIVWLLAQHPLFFFATDAKEVRHGYVSFADPAEQKKMNEQPEPTALDMAFSFMVFLGGTKALFPGITFVTSDLKLEVVVKGPLN